MDYVMYIVSCEVGLPLRDGFDAIGSEIQVYQPLHVPHFRWEFPDLPWFAHFRIVKVLHGLTRLYLRSITARWFGLVTAINHVDLQGDVMYERDYHRQEICRSRTSKGRYESPLREGIRSRL